MSGFGTGPALRAYLPIRPLQFGQSDPMVDRMLSEREAFRAARYFIEQFNEREKSETLELWIGWMDAAIGASDPAETADPAQWHDWVACVDRVVAERA